MDSKRPGNVLKLLLAEVDEVNLEFIAHLSKRVFRKTNTAGRGDALKPRRHVDAVSH
jgi:hypothetical protein